jgi:hypothetical protein
MGDMPRWFRPLVLSMAMVSLGSCDWLMLRLPLNTAALLDAQLTSGSWNIALAFEPLYDRYWAVPGAWVMYQDPVAQLELWVNDRRLPLAATSYLPTTSVLVGEVIRLELRWQRQPIWRQTVVLPAPITVLDCQPAFSDWLRLPDRTLMVQWRKLPEFTACYCQVHPVDHVAFRLPFNTADLQADGRTVVWWSELYDYQPGTSLALTLRPVLAFEQGDPRFQLRLYGPPTVVGTGSL